MSQPQATTKELIVLGEILLEFLRDENAYWHLRRTDLCLDGHLDLDFDRQAVLDRLFPDDETDQ